MYEISFVTNPSVRASSYILYECVHVTESGRGNPKKFPARFARRWLNPPFQISRSATETYTVVKTAVSDLSRTDTGLHEPRRTSIVV